MRATNFAAAELASALARGVCQCVVIGSRTIWGETLKASPQECLRVFAVDEEPLANPRATLVPTRFASEPLATALAKSDFDKMKATLFVWLGGAGYRTMDAVAASLAFIASLPAGSGVVLDYSVERPSLGSLTGKALDAFASRCSSAGGTIKHFIQPQAVTAMLRGLGFQNIVDLAQEDQTPDEGRLVSAVL